ncbi:MAG: DUF1850 domain-containing protein [Chloroflexota bacterium]
MRSGRCLGLAATGLLLAFLVGLALSPTSVLEILEGHEGLVLVRLPIAPGQAFTLSYTHSMYEAQVHEVYRFEPGQGLVLDSVVSSPAALEYYALTQATPLPGGMARASGLGRPLGEVRVRVEGIGRPRLIHDGREIPLEGLVAEGQAVRLRIARVPRALMGLPRGAGESTSAPQHFSTPAQQ